MKQVKLCAKMDRNYLTPGLNQKAYLMIKLTAPVEQESSRVKQNISFVIDRSGSMEGNKLRFTKQAVSFALGHLGTEDHSSIVAFDHRVKTLVESGRVTNHDSIKRMVERLVTGGSTNLSGGVAEGLRQVVSTMGEGQVNRVLLLTDGKANVGITEKDELVNLAGSLADKGVGLSTFGLGKDFEEDLLSGMAEAGKGNFYYIAGPEDIPSIFGEELEGLLKVHGQNLSLHIAPGEGVRVRRVLGYRSEGNSDITLSLPDIYQGEEKTIVTELEIDAGMESLFEDSFTPSLDIHLEYARIEEGVSFERVSERVEMRYGGLNEKEVQFDPEVMAEVELIRGMELKDEVLRLADRGEFEKGRHLMNEHLKVLKQLLAETGKEELQLEIEELLEYVPRFEKKLYDTNIRKKMSHNIYMRKSGHGKRLHIDKGDNPF